MKILPKILFTLLIGCGGPSRTPPPETRPASDTALLSECIRNHSISIAISALKLEEEFSASNMPFQTTEIDNRCVVTGTVSDSGAPEVHVDKHGSVVWILRRFEPREHFAQLDDGVIPNIETAIRVSRAIWPNAPDKELGELTASISGGIWHVSEVTGKHKIELKQADGSITGSIGRPIVTDAGTALLIAEAVLVSIYGEVLIQHQQPLAVGKFGDVWIVEGTLPKGYLGGVAYIKIHSLDGRILQVTHGA